jgi:hypothetical protein
MHTTIIAVLGALLLTALAVYRISRLDQSPRVKATLVTLRVLLLTAILLAFVEPTLTFRRLEQPDHQVPVLLDVSASMRAFAPDSSIAPFLVRLDQLGAGAPRQSLSFPTLWFGDSLRSSAGRHPDFSDKRSFFPTTIETASPRRARTAVVVSDGNWSNASLPQQALQDVNCAYLRLPECTPAPYLELEVTQPPRTVPLDSGCTATVRVSGFSAGADTLSVSCASGTIRVLRRRIAVDSGFFADTVRMAVPTSQRGRRLYTVSARSGRDTPIASQRLVLSVVPKRFAGRVYSTRPRLDRRFIMLAATASGDWEMSNAGPGIRDADALLLFDWDQHARDLLATLPATSTVVFVGCTPCGDTGWVVGRDFSVSGTSDSPIAAEASLPSPESVSRCRDPRLRMHTPILWAVTRGTASRADSTPVVYAGRFERRSCVVVAARGVWRWDFWPLSLQRGSEPFGVSARVMAAVKNAVVLAAADAFYAYPEFDRTRDCDSVALRTVFPAQMAEAAQVKVRVRIAGSSGVSVLDTTARVYPLDNEAVVMLPPLAAGSYAFSVSVSADGRSYTSDDSLRVDPDDSETRSHGQNTAVLDQFARGIDAADTAGWREFLASSMEQAPGGAVSQTVRLGQSWWLLAIVFGLFAVEWVVRRRLELD